MPGYCVADTDGNRPIRGIQVWIGIFCGGVITALLIMYKVKSAMIHTLGAQDWDVSAAGPKLALALFTFLSVDILDCTGTLYSMARFSGVVDDTTSAFPRSTLAYCTNAISISFGSLMGTSPVTAFIESGAGIAEDGRTGLTAMTTGFVSSSPSSFTRLCVHPAVGHGVYSRVGWMMARSIVDINRKYAGDALPAFVTLVFMPFSYSIAYGLIA
ncbi:hypothetical protein A1O7_00757 [Cladophialophora yegresii CBS 114405]|uniref:Uncharacterized protein n=1 Tax=Cladophialophora yegresii CBS 114405 TaxID=1182544 RepID=W9WIJ7_9EURO|nr:uncharacterized protein A1O7_00757 [Cladophialophora yegresii CBS 114405]EXJ64421.1 hypothetical protein A1O7_00757 [Cladophialophora yegresii CBS 114405]